MLRLLLWRLKEGLYQQKRLLNINVCPVQRDQQQLSTVGKILRLIDTLGRLPVVQNTHKLIVRAVVAMLQTSISIVVHLV